MIPSESPFSTHMPHLDASPEYLEYLKQHGKLYRNTLPVSARLSPPEERGEIWPSRYDDSTGESYPTGEVDTCDENTVIVETSQDSVDYVRRDDFSARYETEPTSLTTDFSPVLRKPQLLLEVTPEVIDFLNGNNGKATVKINTGENTPPYADLDHHYRFQEVKIGDLIGKGVIVRGDNKEHLEIVPNQYTNVFEKVRMQMDATLRNTGTMHAPTVPFGITRTGWTIPDGSKVGAIITAYHGDDNFGLELLGSAHLAAQQWFLDIQKAMNTNVRRSQIFELTDANPGYEIICYQLDEMKTTFAAQGWNVTWSGVPGAPGAVSHLFVKIEVA